MRAPPSASATCDTSSTEGCLAANSRNSDTLCEPQTWLGPGRAAPAGQAPSGCSTANDRVGVSCGRWRRLPPVLISARSEHKVRFFPFVYSIKPYRYILAFLPRGFYILFSQKTGERDEKESVRPTLVSGALCVTPPPTRHSVPGELNAYCYVKNNQPARQTHDLHSMV